MSKKARANIGRVSIFGYKKAPVCTDAFLEELVENSLHPLTLELERWHTIIGEHYLDHKLENSATA